LVIWAVGVRGPACKSGQPLSWVLWVGTGAVGGKGEREYWWGDESGEEWVRGQAWGSEDLL